MGLRSLNQGLRKLGTEVPKQLREELKDAAEIVRVEAQARARAQGLVDTGRLVRSMKVSVRGASAFVRNTATATATGRVRVRSAKGSRGGSRTVAAGSREFPYPRVYEYGDGGRRAFLHPALEAKRDEVVKRVDRMLDRLIDNTL